MLIHRLVANKNGIKLLLIELVISFAVLLNAIGLAKEQYLEIIKPVGLDIANQFGVISVPFDPSFDDTELQELDLESIRSISGVLDATEITSFPVGYGGVTVEVGASQLKGNANWVNASVYSIDEHGVAALGLDLIQGRNFTKQEINLLYPGDNMLPDIVVITQKLSLRLFEKNAIGERIHFDDYHSSVVIGVVELLRTPALGANEADYSLLFPWKEVGGSSRYLVRVEPEFRNSTMPEVVQTLLRGMVDRELEGPISMSNLKQQTLSKQTSFASILIILSILIAVLVAIGFAGVTLSMMQQRTHEISIRRALGATKRKLVGDTLIEIVAVCIVALVFGCPFAFLVNKILRVEGIITLHLSLFEGLVSALILVCIVVASVGIVTFTTVSSRYTQSKTE